MAEQDIKQAPAGVAEYLAAIKAADETRERADAELSEKYSGRRGYDEEARQQRIDYARARNPIWDAWDEAVKTAWDALKGSSDPLVKWIAENCWDYRDQAEMILKALPATVDELDELARSEDWCGVWERFRDQAEDAGVLPGVKPMPEAYKAVLDVIRNESCCALEGRGKRRIVAALDAMVTEVKQAEPAAA